MFANSGGFEFNVYSFVHRAPIFVETVCETSLNNSPLQMAMWQDLAGTSKLTDFLNPFFSLTLLNFTK